MLIPNNHAFKGLDPKITPAIKSGALYPPEDFANPELAGMAPKSIYLSCIYPSAGCDPGDAVISMWIKAKKSQDGCGNMGACDDWQEISVGGISRGTTAPIGTEADFCCKPVGAWYIQICNGGGTCSTDSTQPYLWLKTLEGCTDNDWTLISPSVSPVYFGDADPNEDDANCAYPAGSVYYQYCPGQSTSNCVIIKSQATKSNLIRWEKVQACCEGGDWVNTSATPVVKLDAGVEFDCTLDAIECLPVGSIVYRVTPAVEATADAPAAPEKCELWIRLGCENADDCGDWCFINNHPPMTVTQGDAFDFNAEAQALVVPRPPAVTCGADAPTGQRDGDIWIQPIEGCDGECCQNAYVAAACSATGWQKIWGPETGGTAFRGFLSGSLDPSSVIEFPDAVFGDLIQPYPGQHGDELTITLTCPTVVSIDAEADYTVAPVVEIDPATGDPEPRDDLGNIALGVGIVVDGVQLSGSTTTANDWTSNVTLSTSASILLECGEHVIGLNGSSSHTGKVTGFDANGDPIFEPIRQQDAWIDYTQIDVHWEERC